MYVFGVIIVLYFIKILSGSRNVCQRPLPVNFGTPTTIKFCLGIQTSITRIKHYTV